MSAPLRRTAAALREMPAARHIPYAAQVADTVVRTAGGEYVQVFRLGGASFESEDDETLNGWHERLNVTWRNIASPNLALWTHMIRRRERAAPPQAFDPGFAGQLAERYQRRLAGETLMVNELYLSTVYRPVVGRAPSIAARLLQRRATRESSADLADALDACAKLSRTLEASLARYEPEALGVHAGNGRTDSRLLEFLALLVNGERQPMALPRAPLHDVLATSRILFGTEVIEYRLPTRTRLAAMLGIKEYPTPSSVGMLNALLSAPFEFVLTQSFAFLTKATAQGLLQRQYARMGNAGDFALTQAEELIGALDALTGNEFVMGDHHFTLQVLADPTPTREGAPPGERLKALDEAIAQARSRLADTGMTVAREDLALESAFWAQLPGNFAHRPRKAPITSRNFAALSAFHNFPSGRAKGNHWG